LKLLEVWTSLALLEFFFFSYDVFESICIIGVSNVSSDIVFYIAYVIQNSDCHTHA
jgi:hypothetical protein